MAKKKRVNPYKQPATQADVDKAKRKALLLGVQQTMNLVARVLLDDCGFHVKEIVDAAHDECRDTQSIEFFLERMTKLRDSVDAHETTLEDYQEMLAEEANLMFTVGDEVRE